MEGTAADLEQLEQTLRDLSGRPAVVHHFATWCDPCEEELPILAGLLTEAPGDLATVAVAWDLFMMPVRPDEALWACGEFLDRLGASFRTLLVYTGTPEELFASQGIGEGTVPFTDVRGRGGQVVATFAQPIFEEAEQRRFAAALVRASGATQ